jgi:hypothetical protein
VTRRGQQEDLTFTLHSLLKSRLICFICLATTLLLTSLCTARMRLWSWCFSA